MVQITCQHCAYAWDYRGITQGFSVACPRCHRASPNPEAIATIPSGPEAPLLRSLVTAESNLIKSRLKICELIEVELGSKGWHIILAGDSVEKCAAIAEDLAKKKGALEAIGETVKKFKTLVGGDRIGPLEHEVASLNQQLKRLGFAAKRTGTAIDQEAAKALRTQIDEGEAKLKAARDLIENFRPAVM